MSAACARRHNFDVWKLSQGIHVSLSFRDCCFSDLSLQISGQVELLSGVSLVIPIFHCYGHKASCQVLASLMSFVNEVLLLF